MEYLNPVVLEAFEFAARAHNSQMRKYHSDTPYIPHPLAVALVLAKAGFDDEVVMAGALHDVLEDTKVTADEMSKVFGQKVLSLVLGVTEDKALPYNERKQKYLEHLETASQEVLAISAADLIANHTSMLLGLQLPPESWETLDYNPKVYVEKGRHIYEKRVAIIAEKLHHPLAGELVKTQEKLFAEVKPYL